MAAIDDEILMDAEEDAREIEFIRNYLPQELKEKFSDDELYYFLDVIIEYYTTSGVFDAQPDKDGYVDIDLDILGYFDTKMTVNIVKNHELVEKLKLTLPEKLTGVIKCKNPRCITQTERVDDVHFYLVNEEKRIYRCEFCDAYTTFNESR